jgi:hypothetical protein
LRIRMSHPATMGVFCCAKRVSGRKMRTTNDFIATIYGTRKKVQRAR